MTDGLEKIDEVKRWDLAQLPGPDLGTPANIPQIGDLKIPRYRCTGTGSVPVHVKCSCA